MSDTSDDLSAGEIPEDSRIYSANRIQLQQDNIRFRRLLFCLVFWIIIILYIAFIIAAGKSFESTNTQKLILTSAIGLIPTVLLLAIVRRVFESAEDERDSAGPWESFSKELIKLGHEYIGKKFGSK